MGDSIRLPARRLAASLLAAGALALGSAAAHAQADPKPQREPTRVLFDNDEVRVQEVTFRPGEQGANAPRPFRVLRVLEGGPIERTHPDGRTDLIVYKTGDVIVYQAEKAFVPKNVGTTDIVFFVVALKSPKP